MAVVDSYKIILERILESEVIRPSPSEEIASNNPDTWETINYDEIDISWHDLSPLISNLDRWGAIYIWNVMSIPMQDTDGVFLVREGNGDYAPSDRYHVNYTINDINVIKSELERVKGLILDSNNEGDKDNEVLPEGTRWEDITLRFVGDNDVVIIIPGEDGARETNYEGMGFVDKRRGTPTLAWGLLKTFADKEGIINWTNNDDMERDEINRLKKQKQTLSNGLISYFKIEENPFLDYRKERGYKLRMNIENSE